jgi:hypothetical protein
MASGGKKKTTMAKLNRESKLRERRLDKQARKDARKQAAADELANPGSTLNGENDETSLQDDDDPRREEAVPQLADG